MLAPNEFTVGPFAAATPRSLILPRTQYENLAVVGTVDGVPTAVFLAGKFAFHCFMSAENHNWNGLIVPDIRVEVDETSLFDPHHSSAPLGCIIRSDTKLVLQASSEQSFGRSTAVTLYDELPSTDDLRAAFTVWQIVLGEGREKRVLWRTPTPP